MGAGTTLAKLCHHGCHSSNSWHAMYIMDAAAPSKLCVIISWHTKYIMDATTPSKLCVIMAVTAATRGTPCTSWMQQLHQSFVSSRVPQEQLVAHQVHHGCSNSIKALCHQGCHRSNSWHTKYIMDVTTPSELCVIKGATGATRGTPCTSWMLQPHQSFASSRVPQQQLIIRYIHHGCSNVKPR